MAGLLGALARVPGRVAGVARKIREAVLKGTDRVSEVLGMELRRGYESLRGGDAFFPLKGDEKVEKLTASRVVLNVGMFLVGLSPVFWGGVLAVLAHNARALIEAVKIMVNSAYETHHKPLPEHAVEEQTVAVEVATEAMRIPGTIIGTVFGAIATFIWLNLAAIPYTFVGMARLGLQGKFAGVYEDHLKPGARHGVGFIGTAIGWAAGLVPFVLLGFTNIIKHSWYSLITAVQMPLLMMVEAWKGRTHGRQFGLTNVNKAMLKSGETEVANPQGPGKKKQPRTPAEAYGLGGPGTFLGTAIGLIPAAIAAVIGTFYFFIPAFRLAFKSVYNTAASDYWGIKGPVTRKAGEPYTAGQRYGYGWLGTLLGGFIAGLIDIPVILLRTVINSARLFVSVAQGIINLTFGKEPTESFGFALKNQETKRWGFGIPGTILAAIIVGIPCAIIKSVYYAFLFAAVVLGLIFLPWQRAVRQWYKWVTDNQLFSEKNRAQHNPVAEKVMHTMFAALDGFGELPPTEKINPLSKSQELDGAYTFGFLKNVGKFFRKVTINLEFDTDMEELLKDMLTALRSEELTPDELVKKGRYLHIENLVAVTHVMLAHCEKAQNHALHSKAEKAALIAKIEEVSYQVTRALCQETLKQANQPGARLTNSFTEYDWRLVEEKVIIDYEPLSPMVKRVLYMFNPKAKNPDVPKDLKIKATEEAKPLQSFYALRPKHVKKDSNKENNESSSDQEMQDKLTRGASLRFIGGRPPLAVRPAVNDSVSSQPTREPSRI